MGLVMSTRAFEPVSEQTMRNLEIALQDKAKFDALLSDPSDAINLIANLSTTSERGRALAIKALIQGQVWRSRFVYQRSYSDCALTIFKTAKPEQQAEMLDGVSLFYSGYEEIIEILEAATPEHQAAFFALQGRVQQFVSWEKTLKHLHCQSEEEKDDLAAEFKNPGFVERAFNMVAKAKPAQQGAVLCTPENFKIFNERLGAAFVRHLQALLANSSADRAERPALESLR